MRGSGASVVGGNGNENARRDDVKALRELHFLLYNLKKQQLLVRFLRCPERHVICLFLYLC